VADVVAVHIHVSGRVQGVGYRYWCAQEARAAGVTGWVRNLPDGRVEAWFEGARAAVEAVLAWCRAGPPAARVSGLEINDVVPSGASRFEAR
jgi:acylphosphatase